MRQPLIYMHVARLLVIRMVNNETKEEKPIAKPIVEKRRKCKVPTHLLRLRAPPHVRATLPSSESDSESDSDSGSDCSLHISPGADVLLHLS